MLKLNNICKSYNGELILNDISFTIDKGEKVGLIGSNGTGKSTLLNIISGKTIQDKGKVMFTNNEEVGFLRQEFNLEEKNKCVEEFLKNETGIYKLENELKSLEVEIADDESKLEKYSEVQEKYINLDGYNFGYKLETILNGLGLENNIKYRKISELSGGQKNKVMLALVLLQSTDLMLLDEPTNNLDLSSIKWLEEYLSGYKNELLIVSHDRMFLNNTTNRTIEIDRLARNVYCFPGSYSSYIDFKNKKDEQELNLYLNRKEKIESLKRSEIQKKDWAEKGRNQGVKDNDKYTRGYERDRSSSLASNAKKIEKEIKRLDTIEKPNVKPDLKIKIDLQDTKGSKDIVLNDLVCGYKDLFELKCTSQVFKFGEKVILIGDNGSGKSTFIKTLLKKIEPISGTVEIGNGVNIGYIPQDTKIDLDLNIDEFIKKNIDLDSLDDKSKIYTVLNQFGFKYDDRLKLYKSLSPGERTRLYLTTFSLKNVNTLVLDEPTNHLDIEAIDALENVVKDFDGTVISVTHDREFMKNINANRIIELENGSFKEMKMKDFI